MKPAAEMVVLSASLWLRSRLTDRFWRVQEVLKHARVSARRGEGENGSVSPFRLLPAVPGAPRPPHGCEGGMPRPLRV